MSLCCYSYKVVLFIFIYYIYFNEEVILHTIMIVPAHLLSLCFHPPPFYVSPLLHVSSSLLCHLLLFFLTLDNP